ncbi:hypothetical protein J4466_05140 [Candidatus Pacearchaeota archaeon]|nr:hypothetical protein [Candidatus Pacearchaeota archaeon]
MGLKKEDLIRGVLPKIDFDRRPERLKRRIAINYSEERENRSINPKEKNITLSKAADYGNGESLFVEAELDTRANKKYMASVLVALNDSIYVYYNDSWPEANGKVDTFGYGSIKLLGIRPPAMLSSEYREFRNKRHFITDISVCSRVDIYREIDEEYLKAIMWLEEIIKINDSFELKSLFNNLKST